MGLKFYSSREKHFNLMSQFGLFFSCLHLTLFFFLGRIVSTSTPRPPACDWWSRWCGVVLWQASEETDVYRHPGYSQPTSTQSRVPSSPHPSGCCLHPFQHLRVGGYPNADYEKDLDQGGPSFDAPCLNTDLRKDSDEGSPYFDSHRGDALPKLPKCTSPRQPSTQASLFSNPPTASPRPRHLRRASSSSSSSQVDDRHHRHSHLNWQIFSLGESLPSPASNIEYISSNNINRVSPRLFSSPENLPSRDNLPCGDYPMERSEQRSSAVSVTNRHDRCSDKKSKTALVKPSVNSRRYELKGAPKNKSSRPKVHTG